MTRPDLDAKEAAMDKELRETNRLNPAHAYELVKRCRELEAENKRLSSYDSKIDQWIEKWTFPGGIYDDAPAPPKTGPWPGKRP